MAAARGPRQSTSRGIRASRLGPGPCNVRPPTRAGGQRLLTLEHIRKPGHRLQMRTASTRRTYRGKRARDSRDFRENELGKASAPRVGEVRERGCVGDVDLPFPGLHGARVPEHAEGPGDGLPVRSHHAR